MAYLIFTTLKGRELARQSLRRSVVIGRSPECEICVHDILLSRQHCRFEPEGSSWVIVDLASKNGTFLNNEEVGRHVMRDGETVRIGKTAVTFCAGKLEKAPRGGAAYDKPNKPRQRPADPWAALHDTLSGFDYLKSLTEQKAKDRIGGRRSFADRMPVTVDISRLPTPQPSPADPQAYQSDDIYTLLTELASSSWDSIYMNASRPAPTRPAPRPMITGARHPRHRNSSPVDMSLQATPGLLGRATPVQGRPPRRWRRALLGMARGFATVGQSVLVMGIVHLLGKM